MVNLRAVERGNKCSKYNVWNSEKLIKILKNVFLLSWDYNIILCFPSLSPFKTLP